MCIRDRIWTAENFKSKIIHIPGHTNGHICFFFENEKIVYLPDPILEINEIQKNKRDAMLSALGENFGNQAKWSHPEGGLYIWVEFDDQVDITDSHQNSVNDIDVGFHPGTNYAPDGKRGTNYMRLCFGYNDTKQIDEGVSMLAKFFEKEGAL